MSKIVRSGNNVYLGVSDDSTASANFKIFKSNNNSAFNEIGSFPSTRPGNILVDSTGEIHVITFEAFDSLVNDSIGSLVVNSSTGITSTPAFSRVELITATDSINEYVNIRIGASISNNDNMAIVYGLNQNNPATSAFTIQTHINDALGWRLETFTAFPAGQATEYYYPFVSFDSNDNVLIMPVQDEYFVPPGSGSAVNLYYKIPFLKYNTGTDSFSFTMLEDMSADPLAISNYQLLEQSEIFFDENTGTTYFLYRKATSSNPTYPNLFTMVEKNSMGVETKQTLDWANNLNMNWVRMFSYANKLYAISLSYDKIYAVDFTAGNTRELNLTVPVGSYLYISNERGGTASSNSMIDALLIPGSSSAYPNSEYTLFSIPKSEIASLFQ